MNFIEELYYGNIKPNARNSTRSARYEQATEITLKMQEKLKEALAEPERTMLERLIEADDEIIEETGMIDFKLGFSLGVRIMIDCLSVSNNVFIGN